MTTFESEVYAISSDADGVKDFLSNLENLEHLLPQDRIENVKLSNSTASFKIKGLAEINIALQESSAELIVYRNSSKKPFPFDLKVNLTAEGDKTQAQVFFEADINSFMAMMMKTPLTNFLNSLGKNLDRHFQ